MRADVKLGMVISAIVVAVAGAYFIYRDKGGTPLRLAGGISTTSRIAATPGASSPKTPSETAHQPGLQEAARRQGRPSRKGAAQAGTTPEATPPRMRATPPSTAGAKKLSDKVDDGSTGAARQPDARAPVKPTHAAAARKESGPAATKSSAAKKRLGKGSEHARLTGGTDAPPQTLAKRSAQVVQRPTDRKATPPRRGPSPPATATRSTGRTAPSTSGKAAVRPAVEDGAAVDTHRVQAGDTFTSLALMYYGSVKYAALLIDANPQIPDPDRLRIGTAVRIPPATRTGRLAAGAATPPAEKSAGGGARTYRVRPGDSFYAIARDVLGDASRWEELFELNKRLVNGRPKQLQVGEVLTLPKR